MSIFPVMRCMYANSRLLRSASLLPSLLLLLLLLLRPLFTHAGSCLRVPIGADRPKATLQREIDGNSLVVHDPNNVSTQKETPRHSDTIDPFEETAEDRWRASYLRKCKNMHSYKVRSLEELDGQAHQMLHTESLGFFYVDEYERALRFQNDAEALFARQDKQMKNHHVTISVDREQSDSTRGAVIIMVRPLRRRTQDSEDVTCSSIH